MSDLIYRDDLKKTIKSLVRGDVQQLLKIIDGQPKVNAKTEQHDHLKTLFVIKEEDVSNGEFHCEIIGNRGWTSKEDAVEEFKKLVADKKSLTWLWANGREVPTAFIKDCNVIDNDTDTSFKFHEYGNYNGYHYSLSIVELKI